MDQKRVENKEFQYMEKARLNTNKTIGKIHGEKGFQ